jgi:hypothetical protein
VNKGREKGWHYLVPSSALRLKSKYETWQYDQFLAYFLTVCKNAALQEPPEIEEDNGKIAVARMELDEVNKQIVRLVDVLANGALASIETKLRDVEQRKGELESRIRELENEAESKPVDVSKIDWRDSARLRENLRATVKRITVDASNKSFCAEFLDGRVYDFEMNGDEVIITSPDSAKELQFKSAA